jgi:predicted permease
MSELILKLFPIFAFFLIGVSLRRFKIATASEGVFLTKFIFFVTMPALILLTISEFEMTLERWFLPFVCFVVDVGCLLMAMAYTKWKRIEGVQAGNLVIGVALVNSIFMLPFVHAFFGEEGLAKALLFDFGNVLALAAVTYGMAYKYSGQNISRRKIAAKVLFSPIVISLSIALLMTVFSIQVPPLFEAVLRPIGDMTMPALIVALGILFTVNIKKMTIVPAGLFIRMLIGTAIGAIAPSPAGLEGHTFKVMVLMSAAPIGFLSVTLASIAKLDVELATTMASASIFAGLFTIPLIIALLGAI